MERNLRNILQSAIVFISLLAACAAQNKPLYLDPSQPIDARVDDHRVAVTRRYEKIDLQRPPDLPHQIAEKYKAPLQ